MAMWEVCGSNRNVLLTELHGAWTMPGMINPIDAASASVGGLAKLAAMIGESPQVVSNWRVRGVPVIKCLAIETAAQGAVTRRDLRPDDWHQIWPDLAEAKA